MRTKASIETLVDAYTQNSELRYNPSEENYETKREFEERVKKDWHLLDHESIRPTPEMIRTVYEITKDKPIGSLERARAVHKWVNENVIYTYYEGKTMHETYKAGYRFKNARLTYQTRKGRCADMSFLYQSLVIVAGETSAKMVIQKGHILNSVTYAPIFVDCTNYNGFNITPKKKSKILNQSQMRRYYDRVFKNFNDGNITAAAREDNSIDRETIIREPIVAGIIRTPRQLGLWPYAAAITGILLLYKPNVFHKTKEILNNNIRPNTEKAITTAIEATDDLAMKIKYFIAEKIN